MKYSPKPWGREAGVLTVALFAVSLVSYVFSNLGFTAPLPLQLVSLVTICAAVYILVRFKFTSTTYVIRQRDGVTDDVYSLPENNTGDEVIEVRLPPTSDIKYLNNQN